MINNKFNQNFALKSAVIQDDKTGDVLMIGYMNKEALATTRKTGWVYFWSRKRQKLWLKGEESGNRLKVKKIYTDCDKDSLLIIVEVIGKNICHTGRYTCFYKVLTLKK